MTTNNPDPLVERLRKAEKEESNAESFSPDWVVAPGETLKEWREENGLSQRVIAKMLGLDVKLVARLEVGDERIGDEISQRLQAATQIPARLWLNLERTYRSGLAAGKTQL